MTGRSLLSDLGLYVRGRLNSRLSQLLNRRRGGPASPPPPLTEALGAADTPLGGVRLLEGRSNAEREAAVARVLAARGIPFARHRFATFEGRGENFSVDLGSGDRVLLLIAHHDAVPGSPGANDNAAAVAILLRLLERVATRIPPRLRVRLLFTAAEELGYLGARAYARHAPLGGIVGVLSLELCGIGDSLAIWDVPAETAFLGGITRALEALGRLRDDTYHVVGRIPVFGSDHRAFAAAGIPAYGLTVVPGAEAEALRRFVFSPVRSVLVHLVRRPPPFDTYHSSRDRGETLNPAALDAVVGALEAIIAEMG
ncbi:MAG: M28 family peptidase [Candidatus Rokubacteria bacterium]|nr:M28 family peptidase [Candidatus Rokubacteria bacterium]